VWVQHQRARERDPLLLPAGQLARIAMGETGQADLFEHRVYPLRGLRRSDLPQLEPIGDVLRHRHVWP
jgi:hypothetical protein